MFIVKLEGIKTCVVTPQKFTKVLIEILSHFCFKAGITGHVFAGIMGHSKQQENNENCLKGFVSRFNIT